MKIVIQCVNDPLRSKVQDRLKERLPEAVLVYDQERSNIKTYLLCLKEAKGEPIIRLEDDIYLTENFEQKAQTVIDQHPNLLIQFFSMRNADVTHGSRLEPASTFMMTQGIYLPAGMPEAILEYYDQNEEHINSIKGIGIDTFTKYFLISKRLKYFIHVPSLVQHMQIPSAIDTRRSTKRISKTYQA